jgi:high-affinity Fe2+/Pb2+ permease
LALLALVAQPVQAVVAQHRYFLRFQPLVELAVMDHKTAAHLETDFQVALVLLAAAATQMAAVVEGQLRLEQTAPVEAAAQVVQERHLQLRDQAQRTRGAAVAVVLMTALAVAQRVEAKAGL